MSSYTNGLRHHRDHTSRGWGFRSLILLITVSLVPLVAFGSGSEELDGPATKLEAIGFKTDGFPIVAQKVTVHAIVQQYDDPLNTLPQFANLEAEANVDILFDEIPVGDVQQRTRLMFASQDYPDVSFMIGLQDDLLWNAAQSGALRPLGKLINEYAPNWRRAFEQRPAIRDAITMPDGDFYSLPYFNAAQNNYSHLDILGIRKDWLDVLGLPIPHSADGVYDTLLAFRDQIRMEASTGQVVPFFFDYHRPIGGEWDFYNAFDVSMTGHGLGAQRYLSIDSGVVEFGAASPKFKEGVTFIRKLYVDRLIDDRIFVNYEDEGFAKTDPSAATYGMQSFSSIKSPQVQSYVPVPPLMTPTGMRRFRSLPVYIGPNRFTLFKKFDFPEVMIRFIDSWADREYLLEGTYESSGGGRLPFYISRDTATELPWSDEDSYRHQQFKTSFMPYRWEADRYYPYAAYAEKMPDEYINLQQQIGDYVRDTVADWIRTGGVAAEWSDYLTTLERLGLSQLMEFYQMRYERMGPEFVGVRIPGMIHWL